VLYRIAHADEVQSLIRVVELEALVGGARACESRRRGFSVGRADRGRGWDSVAPHSDQPVAKRFIQSATRDAQRQYISRAY
jgi:hypothetical protein